MRVWPIPATSQVSMDKGFEGFFFLKFKKLWMKGLLRLLLALVLTLAAAHPAAAQASGERFYNGEALDAAGAAGTLVDVAKLTLAGDALLYGEPPQPLFLNWTFQFYHHKFQHVYISENGYVTFEGPGNATRIEENITASMGVPVISVVGLPLTAVDNASDSSSGGSGFDDDDSAVADSGVYYGLFADCVNASEGGLADLVTARDPICFVLRWHNLVDAAGGVVDAQLVMTPVGVIILTVAKAPSAAAPTTGFSDGDSTHPEFHGIADAMAVRYDLEFYWAKLAGNRKSVGIGMLIALPVWTAIVFGFVIVLFNKLLKLKMGRRVRSIAAFEQFQREADATRSSRSRSAMSSEDGRSLSVSDSEDHPAAAESAAATEAKM